MKASDAAGSVAPATTFGGVAVTLSLAVLVSRVLAICAALVVVVSPITLVVTIFVVVAVAITV